MDSFCDDDHTAFDADTHDRKSHHHSDYHRANAWGDSDGSSNQTRRHARYSSP